MTYYCATCHQPTQPRLYEPGAGSACHEEAWLMLTYCPSLPDKCNGCEMRDITETEERDLAAELWTDEYNEMGPHERAYCRWLDRE